MAMIGELATPRPVTVPASMPVLEAARHLRDEGIGDVIITDEGDQVVGMLTDRDIAVRLVAEARDAATTMAGDICSRDVVTIRADEDQSKAQELMCTEGIRRLPLVDGKGHAVGIVSLEDLAASHYVSDQELRQVVKATASGYHQRPATSTS
jgi:CBS domain-containing protein